MYIEIIFQIVEIKLILCYSFNKDYLKVNTFLVHIVHIHYSYKS